MKNFIQLFNKVGGIEVLKQYCRAHVLFFAIFQTVFQGFTKKSLEIVRLSVSNKILRKLRRRYQLFIKEYLENEATNLLHTKSEKVWVCWLQGMENAPKLVQKCYYSLQKNLVDREVVLLTEDNYRDYVEFPDYIQKKIDQSIIKGAHMSDLLRLELLIRYGGTWIDSTVLCTGKEIPTYMLDAELFMFQNLKPGLDGHCTSVSNWFITAYSNNPLLMMTRALLYKYWEENDKLVDYFVFHHFFQLAIECYPSEWKKVVPYSNSTPHILLLRLFEQYNDMMWNAIKEQTCFHKLTYKFEKKEEIKKGTYYDILFNEE